MKIYSFKSVLKNEIVNEAKEKVSGNSNPNLTFDQLLKNEFSEWKLNIIKANSDFASIENIFNAKVTLKNTHLI